MNRPTNEPSVPNTLGSIVKQIDDLNRNLLTVDGGGVGSVGYMEVQDESTPITTIELAPNAVQNENIITGAVDGRTIGDGVVTSDHISSISVMVLDDAVASLSQLSPDLGSITSGSLSGITLSGNTTNTGTITGGLIRSAATGPRWEGDSNGLRGIGFSDIVKFNMSFVTGILTVRGIVEADDGSYVPPTAFSAGAIPKMVPNGSFEDYDTTNKPYGWSTVEGTNLFVSSTDFSSEGSRSLKIGSGVAGFSGGAGSRVIPVTPGEKWKFKAKLRHSNGNGTHYMRVNENSSRPTGDYSTSTLRTSFTDVISAQANSGLTGGFFTKSFVYQVPAGIYWVSPSFYNWSSSGYLYVDEVEFERQITADNIAANAVTADKVEANAINGMVITGATIQTAAAGNARLVMNSTDLQGYTAANASTFKLDSAGLLMNTTNASVRTATTNPKVALDSSGIYVTNSGGGREVEMTTNGLDVLAGTNSTPPSSRRIRWLRESDNQIVEELFAFEDSTQRRYNQTLYGPVNGNLVKSFSISLPPSEDPDIPLGLLDIRMEHQPINPSKISIYAGGTYRTILNSNDASDFLQLTSTAKRKINFGVDTATFTASSNSNQRTIAHGLGATPVAVCCFSRGAAGLRWTLQEWQNADSTNIYIQGFQSQGTAVSVAQQFYWVAIG